MLKYHKAHKYPAEEPLIMNQPKKTPRNRPTTTGEEPANIMGQ